MWRLLISFHVERLELRDVERVTNANPISCIARSPISDTYPNFRMYGIIVRCRTVGLVYGNVTTFAYQVISDTGVAFEQSSDI